jgi:peptide/nickel transport system substrate-binding protein
LTGSAKVIAVAMATTLLGASCGGGGKPEQTASPSASPVPRGGTLRVGIHQWYPDGPIDPTTGFGEVSCCMDRTLYSFSGLPIAQGGSVLRPDLATGPPEVSADAMTWTFHIKPGLHYAPPLQAVEITVQDIIRATERTLTPAPKAIQEWSGPLLGGGAVQYFSPVIQGADDFSKGKADSISGLEAPDAHTLRVRLTQAVGDLDYRFSLGVTAPIPPNPFRPDAKLGVAEGHEGDGYERVHVSSGPYMYEGSQSIDFSKPPDQQQPASGYGTHTLVRNPSWNAASDPLRPAYADRIEFSIFDTKPHSIGEVASGGNPEDTVTYRTQYAAKVDSGEIDTVFDATAPTEQVQRYQADPSLQSRLQINEFGDVRYLAFNLAVPPFDDVHVRKAINYVIDKRGIFEAWQHSLNSAAIYGHLAPDSQENNLLASYDPYPSPNHQGDPTAAMREMALSTYDRNHDGKCDGPTCHVPVQWRDSAAYPDVEKVVKRDLGEIGIVLDATIVPGFEMYSACFDHTKHANLCQAGWGGDYPSASVYFPPLYSSSSLDGGLNFSLTGATEQQLAKWGYPIHTVPNLDSRMNDCSIKLGLEQVRCWATFDQYMMEVVVPAVPILTDTAPWTFSARVASFSFDAIAGAPSLDRIALKLSS